MPTGSDKLQISWNPPPQNYSDEPITTLYIILFEDETYHIHPSENLTKEFKSLTPYTTYNCCIAANTTSGPSRLACVTQTTLEAGLYTLQF